ncbi:MAG: Usg family protein [Alphaproteobacteria bacterium]|nr:Usg family protein [Alphaproteobacteria bacterium]
MADLTKQLGNYRLTTAQIYYHMPDSSNLLQEFIWQDYDLAPQFPELKSFLDFWTREIEGKLHSVYVAKREIITTSDYRASDWLGTVQ